jgi:hypothetical protein
MHERSMTQSRSVEEEEATAYHEAGHAVMGCLLGRPPLRVDIVPDACGNVGHTTFPDDFREYEGCLSDDPKFHAYIEIRVMIEAAGTVAHDLKSPARAHDSSDECDEHWARELVMYISVPLPDHGEYVRCRRHRARELISHHGPWVEAVARALVEKKELCGSDVSELRALIGA